MNNSHRCLVSIFSIHCSVASSLKYKGAELPKGSKISLARVMLGFRLLEKQGLEEQLTMLVVLIYFLLFFFFLSDAEMEEQSRKLRGPFATALGSKCKWRTPGYLWWGSA